MNDGQHVLHHPLACLMCARFHQLFKAQSSPDAFGSQKTQWTSLYHLERFSGAFRNEPLRVIRTFESFPLPFSFSSFLDSRALVDLKGVATDLGLRSCKYPFPHFPETGENFEYATFGLFEFKIQKKRGIRHKWGVVFGYKMKKFLSFENIT